MYENGKRRLPDVLPLLVVADLLSIGRTAAYRGARSGRIPTVMGVGSLWLVPSAWVCQQLRLTPEELVERLPETVWNPLRKKARGGKKSEVPA